MRRRPRPRMFELFFFVSSSSSSSLRFFFDKKEPTFLFSRLTRRAPKHAMPIGDGTTVAGTTRDEEEEENDVIIKARRKKAIDDEASTGCSNARRFELELEFVQSLANPRYLHHLATTPNPSSSSSRASSSKTNDEEEENDVLNSPEMVGYLSYLRYWYEDPRYAKYILYPHSLYFLKLLQDPSFRRAMRNPRRVEEVHTAQFQFWANDVTERVKTILASKEEEKAPQDT